MSPMTTMTKTTAPSSSSCGSTTSSSSSNNRLQQQQQQHKFIANLIKEGKVKLTNAILTKNRNEMKEALIILSKTKLTTTTHKTSIRSKCNPQDDDNVVDDDDVEEESSGDNDDDVDESSDDDSDYDEDGSDYDEEDEDSNNTGTVYNYTEYQFCNINLSYDSTLLSECIFGGGGGGRSSNSTGNNNDENENDNDISTDMVRLLVMPFKVVEQMSTPTNTTTTTTVISTNAGSFINGPGKGGGCFISSMRLLLIPPLIRACQYQNYNLVRLLLELDITDPNIIGGSADGLTPLIRMSKIGDLQMIKILLERNDVNIYQYDQQSMNAVIHACTENHIDSVRYLLDYSSKKSNSNSNSSIKSDSNLDYVNGYKVDPPIWYACAHGNAAIVRLLLDEYGAKIRYRRDPTIYSSTPFMEACEWGHLEVVQIVLERDQNTYNNHQHGTSSSSSSSSLLIEDDDDDETRTTTLKARELARSAGYNKVVKLIDFWSFRIQNIENTFTNNNNNNSLSNADVDDNDNNNNDDDDDSEDGNNIKDDGNEDDDCVNENKNENEGNNNNNDNKKKNQKKIDLIPRLLPIVLSMTAKRYDITYRIISRHKDIICSHQ